MSYPETWTRDALEQAADNLLGKPVTMEYGDGKRTVGRVIDAAVDKRGLKVELRLSDPSPLDSLRAELPHMRPASVERDCAARRGGQH